jgi:hypothetical protein
MRIIIFVIVMLFASCLDKDVKVTKPQSELLRTPSDISTSLWVVDYNTGGMRYKVFMDYKTGVAVINVTKDSLEVANMKSYSVSP